jgi:hypothetical protein
MGLEMSCGIAIAGMGSFFGDEEGQRKIEQQCISEIRKSLRGDVVNSPPGSDNWRISPEMAQVFATAKKMIPTLVKQQKQECFDKCIQIIGATRDNCIARCK